MPWTPSPGRSDIRDWFDRRHSKRFIGPDVKKSETHSSAISRIGQPALHYDGIYDRVRWFVDHVVEDSGALESILGEALAFARNEPATRILIRCLFPVSAAGPMNQSALKQGFQIEAQKPLAGDWQGYNLAYISKNHAGRLSLPEVIREEDQLVSVVQAKGVYTRSGLMESMAKAGLVIEQTKYPVSGRDMARILEMFHQALPGSTYLSRERMEAIIRHPGHRVVVARSSHDLEIHSLVSTEQLDLSIQLATGLNRRLSLSEVILIMKSSAMNAARSVSGPLCLPHIDHSLRNGIDMLYCECRAALLPVNAVCRRLGFSYCGRLQKHIVTDGAQTIDERDMDRHTPYRNLNVWAANRDELKSIHDELYPHAAGRGAWCSPA